MWLPLGKAGLSHNMRQLLQCAACYKRNTTYIYICFVMSLLRRYFMNFIQYTCEIFAIMKKKEHEKTYVAAVGKGGSLQRRVTTVCSLL